MFCFGRKFYAGTWSVTGAFFMSIVFGIIFIAVLAFMTPSCLCPSSWKHIETLSPGFKTIYFISLFSLLFIIVFTIMCIYGTLKAQPGKMFPFMVMMIFIEIAAFVGSIFIFIQLAYIDQYLLFDNEKYWNFAKMILKQDSIIGLETTWGKFKILLREFLEVEVDDEPDVNAILNQALKHKVLLLLNASKNFIKVTAVLLLIGINFLFVSTFLSVYSHWKKLSKKMTKNKRPTPVTYACHATPEKSSVMDID